jgi:hypothetical protein
MTPDERKLLSDLFDRTRGAATAPRDREAEEMIAEAVRAQPYAPYLLAQTVLVQEEGLRAAASRIQELEAQLADRDARQEEGGSFLGGIGKTIFGSSEPARPTSVPRVGASSVNAPPAAPQPGGPWGRGPAPTPGFGGGQPGFGAGGPGFGGGQAFGGGRGGFLSGALSTAAGVAGGALLFQGISSLFGSAHAAGPVAQSMADPAALGGASGVNDVFNAMPGADGAKADAAAQDASANDAGDDGPAVDDAGYDDDGGFDDGGGFDSGGDDGGDWA